MIESPHADAVSCPNVLPDAPPLYHCQILANGLLDLANQAASSSSPPCNDAQNCDCKLITFSPNYAPLLMLFTFRPKLQCEARI